MENLEKSERVIAGILQRLLEMGIQDGWIFAFEDLNLEEDYSPFFGGAVKWLIAEDIIKVEGIEEYIDAHTSILSPSLTSRGFAILGRKMKIDGKEISTAEIVKGKSDGSPSSSGIGDFLGGLLGGFTKSLGS